ncbi:histidine phosphatase superfamily [Zychaea mexicana]|uniref:histidine phosphatase superfamily n=1 Tax=Zychaea mexicana TaxID=64656 RepID=UPI0022FDC8EC|nr:histidine phosphatase superfamily [Zychaea mexicana]KAI9489997.1 histidine phosphatase superfamily [Zychaea mexicana]
MVVKCIWVTRHGYREDWVTENPHLPTNRAHDPPLSKVGLKQARELGNYLKDKGIQRAYCSPFYRCLQTVSPLIKDTGIPLYIDNSMSEWYGKAYDKYQQPASIQELKEQHFPFLQTGHVSSIPLPEGCETVKMCHQRSKEGLNKLLNQLDNEADGGPETILLVGHAASVITAVRALLDNETYPVCPATCSLSKLVRKDDGSWDLVLNGDTTHLSDGSQRAWTFAGDIPDYEKNKMVQGEPGALD